MFLNILFNPTGDDSYISLNLPIDLLYFTATTELHKRVGAEPGF